VLGPHETLGLGAAIGRTSGKEDAVDVGISRLYKGTSEIGLADEVALR
jgi:hypothetical protein